MEFLENGKLQETYGKSTYISVYDVVEYTCNCTANKNYLICRHPLFYREENNLDPYNRDMFPSVYLKERVKDPEDLEIDDDCSDPEQDEVDSEPDVEGRARTPSPGLEHIEREEKNRRKRTPANVKFNKAYEVS